MTLVDAEVADRLAHRSWWLHPDGYAACDITTEAGRAIAYLHREVLAPPPGHPMRETIRLQLLEKQMEQQERLWLAELRRKAYVDVRLWR